jgi:hypothetical protein
MPNERVQIINADHPHFEEYGRWTGDTIVVLGQRMGRVDLENCRHAVNACFVKPGDIKQVLDPDAALKQQRRRRR